MHSSDPLTPHLGCWARVRRFDTRQLDAMDGADLWRLHAMRRTLWVVPRTDAGRLYAAVGAKISARERRRIEAGVDRDDAGAWLKHVESELLQAIRVGDGGAMGTIHAQDAATALSTFIDLACRGGSDRDRVHREVAESLHFIVFVSRDRATGQRRIREVVRPVLRDGRAETDPILTWDPTSDRWDVDAFDAFSELGVGLGRDR